MMKTVFWVLLLVGVSLGQEAGSTPDGTTSQDQLAGVSTSANTHPLERVQTPTYEDLYCAGFITKQDVPHDTFVAGGLHSPHATKFVKNEVIFLSGSKFKEGDRVALIRELVDPNRYEMFPGQFKLMSATGRPYAELGHARVIDTRHNMAIALLDFSCEPIVVGDQVIALTERQQVSYRNPHRFDRFSPPNGKTSGQIVLGKDFDNFLGTGRKAYLTVGAEKGVKVGDYFRITRDYTEDLKDPVDSLSFKASYAEDTQMHPPSVESAWWKRSKGPVVHVKDMPRRAMGEMIILSTTPTSATGMVTFALEDIHVGDGVELEETPPATASVSDETPVQK
jgi:hypothetical protein